MANELLTPDIIAKESIMVLLENMVFAGMVHRNYSNEFQKVGDTITIRKPPTFTAAEWGGTTVTVQDAKETSTSVTMDKIVDVSFAIGSKELALDIRDFSEQFIQPAMQAHARYLDSALAGLYVDINNYTAVSATPAITDLFAIDTIMNTNLVPMNGRNLVFGSATKNKYAPLDALLHAEKSGSTEALRMASVGRVANMDTYMDQMIKTHTKGTATSANATGTKGASTVALASLSAATATLKKGDLFTIQDDSTVYVVTEDATGSSSAIAALKIYPALAQDCTSKAITVIDTAKVQNLAFHKNAFALVTRPLEVPFGAKWAQTMSFEGVSVRVVADYDMDKKQDVMSLDFLCGFKTLDPRLACRLMG